MTTTASLAAALILSLEGCKLTAYRDSGGILTVGIGHTGQDVTEGLTITPERAVELFQKDAAPLLEMVKDKNVVEGAALVSFGYNCGQGALKRLLAGEISLETYGRKDRKGNTLTGLVNRRNLEMQLMGATMTVVARNGD